MTKKAVTRATRGAEWLDKVYPEWFTHIDVTQLDLNDGCACVWGQIVEIDEDEEVTTWLYAGSFMVNADDGYGLACYSLDLPYGWMGRHGFLPDNGHDGFALDVAWTDLVKDRYNRGLVL